MFNLCVLGGFLCNFNDSFNLSDSSDYLCIDIFLFYSTTRFLGFLFVFSKGIGETSMQYRPRWNVSLFKELYIVPKAF